MADIVLYDRTGSAVTYSGVDTITTDTPTDGETATFTYGKVVDGTEIDLALADGDQAVSIPAGSLVREATIKKPETLTPEHIKKGVDVAGVIGTFAGDEMEKTVDLNMADGDQIVDADPDTVMTRVTVKKPETLVPENIVEGVEIGGVVGNKTMVKAPHYLIDGVGELQLVDDYFDYPPEAVRAYAFSSANISYINLSKVKVVDSCAFIKCSLKNVQLPNCISVSNSGFADCNIPCIDLPMCKTVGPNAFIRTPLSKVLIPKCETIGDYAFFACRSLTEIHLPECRTIGVYTFGNGSLKEIDIPKCETIGNYAFSNNSLSIVSFSQCITIGQNAFYACGNLEKAVFNNCESIGEGAFYQCKKLSIISFPKCKTIGGVAFRGGYNSSIGAPITEAIFPECTTIGGGAFTGCTKLAKISFPKCETVGVGAFSGYNGSNYINNFSIKELIFPACKSVLSYAFDGVQRASVAYFPRATYIGFRAFDYCFSLSCAYFFSATYFGSQAMISCAWLKSIYILSPSVPTLEHSNAFSTVGVFGYSIYVRESLISNYLSASKWSYFSSRFVGMTDEEVETLITEMEAKYETANSDTTV